MEKSHIKRPASEHPRVQLLVSVRLTNQTPHGINFYGDRPVSNKLDQFISALHSISKLRFASETFFFSLSEDYVWGKDFIISEIENTFPSARITNHQLDSFERWRSVAEQIHEDIDIILLFTNHDHVYLPRSNRVFEQFVENMSDLGPRTIGAITHWPEAVSRLGLEWAGKKNDSNSYFLSTTTWTIGTCLVSRTLFREWWEEDFTRGMKIVRPDNPFGPSVTFKESLLITPAIELFRHLDGYSHVNISSPSAQPLRPCCVVEGNHRIHKDWIRGYFSTRKPGIELPNIADEPQAGSWRQTIELALLATSHRINLKTLRRLVYQGLQRPWQITPYLLFELLTNKHFLVKIPVSLLAVARAVPAKIYRLFRGQNSSLPLELRQFVAQISRKVKLRKS